MRVFLFRLLLDINLNVFDFFSHRELGLDMRLRESDFTPINPLDFYSTTLYHKHKDVANDSRHNQVGIFVLIASFGRSYSIFWRKRKKLWWFKTIKVNNFLQFSITFHTSTLLFV